MERAHTAPVIIEELVDYGYDLGYADGFKLGIEREMERGRQEGLEDGRRIAQAAVLIVLRARGIAVSDAIAARVHDCRDVDVLREWLRRAESATSLDEVFVS